MTVKKTVKYVCSAVLSLLVAVMIAAVGYLTYCNMTGRIAFIGNYAMVKIISPSMEPTIPQGEYILVKKVGASEIAVGDVAIFVSRDPDIYGCLNTHRVVDINMTDSGPEFVTKGDNNPVNDTLATKAQDIRGKYLNNIPFVTKFAGIFAKKWVFFTFIIIPAFLLIVICVLDIVKKSNEVKADILVQREVERLKQQAARGELVLPPDSGDDDAPDTHSRE